jgi:hypothetical protein
MAVRAIVALKPGLCNVRFLLIELLSRIMEESAHVILGLSNDWDPLLSGNVYANPKARVFACAVAIRNGLAGATRDV